MQLLTTTKAYELPTDTLLARLRYQRSLVDLNSDLETKKSFEQSVLWVYQHLNPYLHKNLDPFFELIAMRQLVLILRYRFAGEFPPEWFLRDVLVAKKLVEVSRHIAQTDLLVLKLESLLKEHYPFTEHLFKSYNNQGPGAVEQQLSRGILSHGHRKARNQLMLHIFQYFIDLRNVLTIIKFWRWQVTKNPDFIPGGKIPVFNLTRVWLKQDHQMLVRLVKQQVTIPISEPESRKVEQDFFQGITRFLYRSGKDPLGLGVIIDYLWRLKIATHNRALKRLMVESPDEMYDEAFLL